MEEVKREANGRWKAGVSPNPKGRPKGGSLLSDIIRENFAEEIDVIIDGEVTKRERRQIMANALAQIISTGEVKLPNRPRPDGGVDIGAFYKYGAAEWIKHLVRILRYVEPPINQIEFDGDVSGIFFDKDVE